MAKRTAMVEQAWDGTWTAMIIADDALVLGTGHTRREAVTDLRQGIDGTREYLTENRRTCTRYVFSTAQPGSDLLIISVEASQLQTRMVLRCSLSQTCRV